MISPAMCIVSFICYQRSLETCPYYCDQGWRQGNVAKCHGKLRTFSSLYISSIYCSKLSTSDSWLTSWDCPVATAVGNISPGLVTKSKWTTEGAHKNKGILVPVLLCIKGFQMVKTTVRSNLAMNLLRTFPLDPLPIPAVLREGVGRLQSKAFKRKETFPGKI